MSHLCCPSCRLRFTAAAAAYLTRCPECSLPAAQVDGAQGLLGFKLFDALDVSETLPDAIAVMLWNPGPDGPQS